MRQKHEVIEVSDSQLLAAMDPNGAVLKYGEIVAHLETALRKPGNLLYRADEKAMRRLQAVGVAMSATIPPQHLIDKTLDLAALSTCRSKRGVVLWKRRGVRRSDVRAVQPTHRRVLVCGPRVALRAHSGGIRRSAWHQDDHRVRESRVVGVRTNRVPPGVAARERSNAMSAVVNLDTRDVAAHAIVVKLVGDRLVTVDAHVFGEWAAHAGIDVGEEKRLDWWVVTHVPNGRRLRCPGQMTEREAIDLASALDRRQVQVPVYGGPSDVASLAELRESNSEFGDAAKVVRSVVFDTIGRCFEV